MRVDDDDAEDDAGEADGARMHGGVAEGARDDGEADVVARREEGEERDDVRELHGAEEPLEGGGHGHERHHVERLRWMTLPRNQA